MTFKKTTALLATTALATALPLSHVLGASTAEVPAQERLPVEMTMPMVPAPMTSTDQIMTEVVAEIAASDAEDVIEVDGEDLLNILQDALDELFAANEAYADDGDDEDDDEDGDDDDQDDDSDDDEDSDEDGSDEDDDADEDGDDDADGDDDGHDDGDEDTDEDDSDDGEDGDDEGSDDNEDS